LLVSAVQYRPRRDEGLEASRAALVALAAGPRCDLVVLPEMAVPGYVFADEAAARAVAEAPEGPTFQALRAVARARRAWVVAGFPELAEERLFNSAMIIDRRGHLHGVYRKTLLFEADLTWASPGDSGYLCVDSGAGRFGVGICMDLNDDRFIDWLRVEQPDAIAFPTNWVQEDGSVWEYWAWRMAGVRGALVAANRWGTEETTSFRGESAILRQNVLHAWAPPRGDGALTADLPLA
jgi:predicted amidohydrolase